MDEDSSSPDGLAPEDVDELIDPAELPAWREDG
jgi:hypothetical protein